MNPNEIKYNSPDTAYANGELWYKKKIVTETNDVTYQIRPIFIIDKGNKIEVSSAFLYKFFQLSEKCVILENSSLDSELRYIWKNGVYQDAKDSDIMRILTGYIESYNLRLLNPAVLKQALELNDCTCEHYEHDIMNTNEDIINFQNGLLNIKTMELTQHTPELMSTIQIPANWTGENTATPNFDKFLNTLTNNNIEVQKLILQYMGAIISNVQGWRYKKALFLLGKGNTGKSTLINLISRLLGSKNVAERDLRSLNERFGKTAAYNRRLIYSNDLSFMKIEENAIFKNLTGGDTISIEYKNKEAFDFKFKGFLLYGMNALPHFGGDKGEHVYRRIIIVKCDNVIPSSELDPFLEQKLYEERDGIIYKCIMSFKKTIENNYQFDIPKECDDSLNEYKKENSYPVEFWTTYVEKVQESKELLESNKLYSNYRVWCGQEGITRIASAPEFRKEISGYCGKAWSELTRRTKNGVILKDYVMNEHWKSEHSIGEVRCIT